MCVSRIRYFTGEAAPWRRVRREELGERRIAKTFFEKILPNSKLLTPISAPQALGVLPTALPFSVRKLFMYSYGALVIKKLYKDT